MHLGETLTYQILGKRALGADVLFLFCLGIDLVNSIDENLANVNSYLYAFFLSDSSDEDSSNYIPMQPR